MKRLIILFSTLFLFIQVNAQQLGVNAIAGTTLVDVEAALESPLDDWNTVSYGGYICGFFPAGEGLSIGGEIGFHRLYYWEERYGTTYGTRYRWGDISTVLIGPAIKLYLESLFVQSAIDLRIFTDGSGVVPGVMVGGGYEIGLTDVLFLPAGLRADVIFGSGTPITFNLTVGLIYNFE